MNESFKFLKTSEVQKSQGKGKGKEKDNGQREEYSSDDFGDDDIFAQIDEETLEKLAAAEKEAYAGGYRVGTMPSSSLARSDMKTLSSAPGRSQITDVITIEDDEDEGYDKENIPVPTRHVRRRIEENATSGSTNRGGKAKPIVLAKFESDVIDISDSD